MRQLSTQNAKKLQKKEHFTGYKGELLKGERWVLERDDPYFPCALKEIQDPPERLYLIGNPSALQAGLAIVGARKATPYGISCARYFAAHAAQRGITIISGGARGCDTAAHEAALAVNGKTLVFLGGGCDELYPAQNKELFQEIANRGGAIVSEYAWDYPPLRHTFLARNRLIAGLAKATLIVEAGLPSGTFSTADEALNASREVLVIPGSIYAKTSRGANRLLYQGATPIVDTESFDDTLFSVFGVMKSERNQQNPISNSTLSKNAKMLYEILCKEQLRKEEIHERLNKITNTVERIMPETIIIELEMNGYIGRYPDGSYGPAKYLG